MLSSLSSSSRARANGVTAGLTNQQHSHEGLRELPTLPLPAQTSHHGERRRDGPRGRLRTDAVTSFGPSEGCAMLIVVRSNAQSACSLGFKPILQQTR